MAQLPRFAAIRSYSAQLWSRLRHLLDQRAEKDKQAWGSSMEYRRRYTNPDEAMRARKDPQTPRRRSSDAE
jgi:hypothetical protein